LLSLNPECNQELRSELQYRRLVTARWRWRWRGSCGHVLMQARAHCFTHSFMHPGRQACGQAGGRSAVLGYVETASSSGRLRDKRSVHEFASGLQPVRTQPESSVERARHGPRGSLRFTLAGATPAQYRVRNVHETKSMQFRQTHAWKAICAHQDKFSRAARGRALDAPNTWCKQLMKSGSATMGTRGTMEVQRCEPPPGRRTTNMGWGPGGSQACS